MTDEAHEFLEDIRGKKRIARGAKYRKGHKGRKGCVLPSDFLTKKQLEERNGPIMTVKLNAPMTWEEFKTLSDNLQREYLIHLRNTYNISFCLMGKMFGVSETMVRKKFKEFGIQKPTNTRCSQSKEYKARVNRWNKFINKCDHENSDAKKEAAYNEEFTSNCTQEGSSCEIRHVTILMNGSSDDIYNAIIGLLNSMPNDRRYTANISIDECMVVSLTSAGEPDVNDTGKE